VIDQVLTQHLVVQGRADLLGARMRVHVDQAGQQPPAVHHNVRVRHRLLAQPVPVNPERALLALRQDDSPYL
jgi:hypothetical protein